MIPRGDLERKRRRARTPGWLGCAPITNDAPGGREVWGDVSPQRGYGGGAPIARGRLSGQFCQWDGVFTPSCYIHSQLN
jgi:hypothetical protein